MKGKAILIAILIIVVFNSKAQLDDFPILKRPYLGQKPPGLKPEIFAAGIISTGYHEDGGPAFTPDLKEMYFRIAQRPYSAIFFMAYEDGRWKKLQTAPFSGKYSDGAPFVSYDGSRLFFSSNRPISGTGEPRSDEDIWYVERTENRWSEPRHLNKSVNSEQSEWKPSLSEKSNLYFTSRRGENQSGWKIYVSEYNGSDYSPPVEFDEKINRKYQPCCPCIARDESFLIFASNQEKGRRLDLFVTVREIDGGWSDPINLGDRVNSSSDDLFPILTPDNKYLFFTSWRSGHQSYSEEQKSYADFIEIYDSPGNGWGGDIYWVDARIIEKFKREN